MVGCRSSDVPVFDVATGAGHWMGVVVRQSRLGQTMVNVSVHPQDLTKLQLKDIKEKLKSFYKDTSACNVTSLYLTERKQVWSLSSFEVSCRLLMCDLN